MLAVPVIPTSLPACLCLPACPPPNPTPGTLRRWHNHLNPNIKRGQWSRPEDEIIVRFHRRFGNQVRVGGVEGCGCGWRGVGVVWRL